MIVPALESKSPPTSSPARPVRVAHLLHTVAHGGVETALLNWFSKFDTRLETRLYCFTNPGATERPFLTAATAQGLEVGRLPWSRWKPVWRCARLMAEEVRRHRIDILHCHNTYANLVGILTARLTPVRTVTTHYVWGDFTLVRNFLQWVDKHLMPYFDQVTAHCERCFHDTVSRGYSAEKLRLAICGYPGRNIELPDSERAARRREMGIADDQRVLIYGARFWPEKAHPNLLEAMTILRHSHPEALLLLPGTGPDLGMAKARCTELGLDHSVRFLGFHDDYETLLAISDIMVHPSDNEGVALAVCAAMAAGLPIVASRVGGLTEILAHERSAILIPPRSPRELAAAVSSLLEDSARAAALGAAARKFIREEYSLEVATERLTAIYEEMMSRAAVGRRR